MLWIPDRPLLTNNKSRFHTAQNYLIKPGLVLLLLELLEISSGSSMDFTLVASFYLV